MNEYQYNTVRETEGQVKFLYQNMTAQQQANIQKLLDLVDINSLQFSSHFFDKGLNVTESQVKTLLQGKKYSIIEYNQTPIRFNNKVDNRVLIRANIRNGLDFCLVVSVTTNTIVTGYYNSVNDCHKSLNLSRYNVPSREMENR